MPPVIVKSWLTCPNPECRGEIPILVEGHFEGEQFVIDRTHSARTEKIIYLTSEQRSQIETCRAVRRAYRRQVHYSGPEPLPDLP